MDRSDLTRSAFHEAGHAVTAVLVSRPFRFVSLRQMTERGAAYTEGVVYSLDDERVRHAEIRKGIISEPELLISLSGMLAETMCVRVYDREAQISGAHDVHNLTVAMCLRLGCTPEEVATHPEWKRIEADGIQKCMGLLRDNWRAVQELALLLLQHGRVSFRTTEALVRSFGASGTNGDTEA